LLNRSGVPLLRKTPDSRRDTLRDATEGAATDAVFEPVLAQVSKNLSKNDNVLLIGLGPADFLGALSATGAEVTVQKDEAGDLATYAAGRFQRVIVPWSHLRGIRWPPFAALRRVLKTGGDCFLLLFADADVGAALASLSDSGFIAYQEESVLNDRIFVLRLERPTRRDTPVPLLQRHRQNS
jgi:hypothetical protein